MRQGEPGDELYIIEEGEQKVKAQKSRGPEEGEHGFKLPKGLPPQLFFEVESEFQFTMAKSVKKHFAQEHWENVRWMIGEHLK